MWARRGFAKTWQRRTAKTAIFLVGLSGFLPLALIGRGQHAVSVWHGLGILALAAYGAGASWISYPSQFRSVGLRRLERFRTRAAADHLEGRDQRFALVLQDPAKPPFDSVASRADPIMVASHMAFVLAIPVGWLLMLSSTRAGFAHLFTLLAVSAPLTAPKILSALIRRRVRVTRVQGHCPDCDYDLLPDKARPESRERCPECGLRYPLFDMVEYLRNGKASAEAKPDTVP